MLICTNDVLLTSITLTSLEPDSLRGESKSPFRKVHQMLLSTVPIKSLSPLPKARQRIPLTSLGIYNTNRKKERKGTVFIINQLSVVVMKKYKNGTKLPFTFNSIFVGTNWGALLQALTVDSPPPPDNSTPLGKTRRV